MTEKQYSLVYYADKGGAFIKNNETGTEWYHDSRASLLEIVNKLNGLAEENEQLKFDKQQLHMAMSREEVRHKQFKDKAFDLIDAKIKEYQKYDGYDTEKYYIGTQLLNELKRELQE